MSVHEHRTERIRASEERERGNGVGGGISVGGGNGDGNGVGGGNGDVNVYGDGDGNGGKTGVYLNDGLQDGNGVRERGRGGEGGGEANMRNTTQKSCGRDVEKGKTQAEEENDETRK